MPRVARIPYLNSAPFYLNWDRLEEISEGQWSPAVLPPRQLGQAAEAGTVDAGLLPIADLLRLKESFEPVLFHTGGSEISYGIASADRVESVLLFVRDQGRGSGKPPASPPDSPGRVMISAEAARLHAARIAVTEESSTSVRLLRLLLEVHHDVRPASYEAIIPGPSGGRDQAPPSEFQAALVIGDQALRWLRRPPAGFILGMDLASGWHAWTGLPFVFARWGVRRALPDASKKWLGQFLERSLWAAEGRFRDLVQDLPGDLGTTEELTFYLENFTYRLGPEELRAAARFEELLLEHEIAL